jgi:hypothetical protein
MKLLLTVERNSTQPNKNNGSVQLEPHNKKKKSEQKKKRKNKLKQNVPFFPPKNDFLYNRH